MNSLILLLLTVGWLLAAITVGLIVGFSLQSFLLGLALPLLPVVLDSWNQYLNVRRAGSDRDATAAQIGDVLAQPDGGTVLPTRSLTWQQPDPFLRLPQRRGINRFRGRRCALNAVVVVRDPHPPLQTRDLYPGALRDLRQRSFTLPSDCGDAPTELGWIRLHHGDHPSRRAQTPSPSGDNQTLSSPD